MQVEARVWLHCCCLWLLVFCWVSPFWGNVAVNYLEVKINVGVLWNVAISNWSLDESWSPHLISWAMDLSLSSWVQLLNGKLPALKHICTADIESACSSLRIFLSWVGHNSTILKLSGPMDGGPLTSVASIFIGVSFLNNINSKISIFQRSVIVLVVLSIWPKNVWQSLDVYCLGSGHNQCKIFHF